MNNEIRAYLKNNNLYIKRITIKKTVTIIVTNKNEIAVKKASNDIKKVYKYLDARTFIYHPKIIHKDNNYYFYEYINHIRIPAEQKSIDMIKLVAMLHKKTTFYKNVNEDYYKKIYEDIKNRIAYLENYYNDIAEIVEKEEYMSPANYLYIRNISKIFISLDYAKYNIEKWYKIIEEKKRIRVVYLHNNISLDHYLVGDKPYLISWEKSKIDFPIYDLINLYQKYYQELDFCDLLKSYEQNYNWLPEEKNLFICLISLPKKIEFRKEEYELCKEIRVFYNYLNANQKLINDYFTNKKEQTTA